MATAWKKLFPDGRGLQDGNYLNRIFTGLAAIQSLVSGALTVTGATILSGATTLSGLVTFSGGSVNSGATVNTPTTVAAVGTSLGTAALIGTAVSNVVVTVTASTEGVKLPTAATGKAITIWADPSVGNKVYARATGQKIGAATTATTAYALVKNTATKFYAVNATNWRVEKGT